MKPIPAGWNYLALGDICEPTPRRNPRNDGDGTFQYVDIDAVDNRRLEIVDPKELPRNLAPSRARHEIRSGDVIFSLVRPYLRNIARVPKALDRQIASTAFHVLRPSPCITTDYLYYAVQRDAFIRSVVTYGESPPAARDDEFARLLIPVAPLAEQVRVVEQVERYRSLLDEANLGLARAVRHLDRLRDATLAHAVRGQLSLDRDSSDQPLASRYPEHWGRAAIGEVARFVTDGDHNPPKRVATGVPHLTARNVTRYGIDTSNCTFIDEGDFARSRVRYDPRPGDVIVTCVGTIGRTAIVPRGLRFSADRNLAAIRLGESMDARFVKYVLDSPGHQGQMGSASGSTAQPHLYLRDLRALIVPVPPLDEQTAIADEIDRRMSVIDVLRASALLSLDKAEQIWQAVLNEALRGHLLGRRLVA